MQEDWDQAKGCTFHLQVRGDSPTDCHPYLDVSGTRQQLLGTHAGPALMHARARTQIHTYMG
eukprot:1157702-Pelagomonas_calceolata.AAC.3